MIVTLVLRPASCVLRREGPMSYVLCPRILCAVVGGVPSLHPGVASAASDAHDLRIADFSRQWRGVVHNDVAFFGASGRKVEVLCPRILCGVDGGVPSLHPGVASAASDAHDLRTADFSRQGRGVVHNDVAFFGASGRRVEVLCPMSYVLCPRILCGVDGGVPSLHPGVASAASDAHDLRIADFSRQGRSVVRNDRALLSSAKMHEDPGHRTAEPLPHPNSGPRTSDFGPSRRRTQDAGRRTKVAIISRRRTQDAGRRDNRVPKK